MNRKHKLIFIALCLLPFVTAMSFRALDNYQFALEQQKTRKLRPDYFPQNSSPYEIELDHNYTCQKLQADTDSLVNKGGNISELP